MIKILEEQSRICQDGKKRRWVRVKCSYCQEDIWKIKRDIKRSKNVFCTQQCLGKFRERKIDVKCSYCGNEVKKKIAHTKNNKTGYFFCNRICKDSAHKDMNIFRSFKILNCKICSKPVEVDSRSSSVICDECKPVTKPRKIVDYFKVIEGKEETNSFYTLKNFLIEEGLKENKCEICGIDEWLGQSLICQLHHKDGNRKNNHLSNLEMVCPNCHTQTDTWGTKNRNMVAIIQR